jgi:hypothetical protein
MATGVVSGLIAVMLDANRAGAEQRWLDYENSLKRNQRTSFVAPPALSANAVKALLEYSATLLHDDAGVNYGPLEQGAGLVNGLGATTLAYNIDTTRSAGQYWLTAEIAPVTTFGTIEVPWSRTVIWGTQLLRGTSVVDLHQAGWEDNIVWGTGALSNIVWGMFSEEDNIVWGTLMEEDNIVWGTSLPLSTALTWAGNAGLEDNIVWGTSSAVWADNIVWGSGLIGYARGLNIVWGTFSGDEDNIVWGTLDEDNIVWGTSANTVSVLGSLSGGAL